MVQGAALEHGVEFPLVSIGQAGVVDTRGVGVVEHLHTMLLQGLAQFLCFYKRCWSPIWLQ